MHDSTSQADIFRAEYAKNAAKSMLDVIRAITKRAGRITRIALGVSMPHQIGYILALAIPHMHFNSPTAFLEAVTMVLLAIGVPIATDLLILNCIETIGAAAASRGSKRRAFALMFVPVAASGTVNFLAPAPMLIKVLAAFIVTMVPMAESLRFIKPDFARIEAMETEFAVTSVPSKPGRVVSDQELKARKRAGYDRMSPSDKRDWTRNYKPRGRKDQSPDFPMQIVAAIGDSVPVSPAPAGR